MHKNRTARCDRPDVWQLSCSLRGWEPTAPPPVPAQQREAVRLSLPGGALARAEPPRQPHPGGRGAVAVSHAAGQPPPRGAEMNRETRMGNGETEPAADAPV